MKNSLMAALFLMALSPLASATNLSLNCSSTQTSLGKVKITGQLLIGPAAAGNPPSLNTLSGKLSFTQDEQNGTIDSNGDYYRDGKDLTQGSGEINLTIPGQKSYFVLSLSPGSKQWSLRQLPGSNHSAMTCTQNEVP